VKESLNRLIHPQLRYFDLLRNKYFGNDLNSSRTLKLKKIHGYSQERISKKVGQIGFVSEVGVTCRKDDET
jgi:hypothetical protein